MSALCSPFCAVPSLLFCSTKAGTTACVNLSVI
jgi:hypothetical protein